MTNLTPDWNLIFNFVTALGIFEVIKRTALYILQNNIFKKNQEKREIADLAFRATVNLKQNQFLVPLDKETVGKLYMSAHLLDDGKEELSGQLMLLINYPTLIETLKRNDDKIGIPVNSVEIHRSQIEMYNISEKLIPKLRKMRYEPIIDVGFYLAKIMETVKEIYRWVN